MSIGDPICPTCGQYLSGNFLVNVPHNNTLLDYSQAHSTTAIDSYTWDKALEVAARICIEMVPYPAEDKNHELISEWLGKAAENIRNRKLDID